MVEHSTQGEQQKPKRRELFFVLLFQFSSILLCLLSLILGVGDTAAEEFVPIPLHALNRGDYSADDFIYSFQKIGLDLIVEVLLDRESHAVDISSRATAVAVGMLTPVPTITPGIGGRKNSDGNQLAEITPENPTLMPQSSETIIVEPKSTHTGQPTQQPSSPPVNPPAPRHTYPPYNSPIATPSPTKKPENFSPETATFTPTIRNQDTGTPTPTHTSTEQTPTTDSPTESITATVTGTVPSTSTDLPSTFPTTTVSPTGTTTPSSSPTLIVTNTVTYTPTASSTSTAANVPTITPTNSPAVSATNSPTITPSLTSTPTPENTATQTPTGSQNPTVTQTQTHTPTISVEVTNTATQTPIASPNPTATNTPTVSRTSTATNSPTSSPVPTGTNTPTHTPTNSSPPTATNTATYTPTNLPIPTATNTATIAPTALPTSTVTNTSTSTPTETPTPTSTHTPSAAPTFTPTNTPTAVATAITSPTPTPALPDCYIGQPPGIIPSDDAFIRASSPSSNFGSQPEIEVRPDSGANRRGLIRFDLSSIPAGSIVTNASLYLYEIDKKPDQQTHLYRITSMWNESSVTWDFPWANLGGDFDNSVTYATFVPNQSNCMLTIDLTTLVQQWLNGMPNYGFLLYSTGPNHILRYASKENSVADQHPRLDITYIEPTFSSSYSDFIQNVPNSGLSNHLVK